MNTNEPLVSIIMPVRNGERFIGEAIRSIYAQDYRAWELLVVDGNSTDRTAEICREFPEAQFMTQPGRGFPDAYNFGVSRARGEWLAFLEHDDTWTPNKLRVQMERMSQKPELQYTMTRAEIFLEPGCRLPAGYRPEWLEKPQIGCVLSTFVARKSVFKTLGPFDTTLRCASDVDWFARAKDRKIPTEFIDEVLLRKRVHDQNHTQQTQINNVELLQVMKRSLDRQRAQINPISHA